MNRNGRLILKTLHRLKPLAVALSLAFGASINASASAQTPEQELPEVKVEAQAVDSGFSAKSAPYATKSDAPLFETPQSITVLTRDLLDSQQANSLTDALRNVAGVVSGNFGRRGLGDDFIIRGQRANESRFVDGLSVAENFFIAEEIYGAERIEVLKGPASILFGNVQPGGMVNVVSKRPRLEPLTEAGVTFGSDNYKQATFDFGRPLSGSGRAAFRVNGLVRDTDDPTDFVFFKTRWIAPSLSLDLGPNTDFTLLASYIERDWLRQQGLSPRGTILSNPNGPIPRNRFIGEPGFGPYHVYRTRIGYALEHRFDSGWKLRQNFRVEDYDVNGRAVFNRALQANGRTQNRQGTLQDVFGQGIALDTYVAKKLELAGTAHDLTFGVDLNRRRERNANTRCPVAPIDLFNPVYGAPVRCPAIPTTDTTTKIPFVGLYARDQIKIGERLMVSLGARRDRVTTTTVNNRTGVKQEPKDAATTGMAGVLYEVVPGVAPYVSYATSFLPTSGTDFSGAPFKPETGKQGELGVKFERDGGRTVATLAVYDLRRQNVLTADTANPGFSVQTGEQRSRGFEAELAADLRNGWNWWAAYTYTDSEVTRDNTARNVGKPLNNVPRHSATAWSTYRFRGDGPLQGWGFGAGARYEGEKRGFSFDYVIPEYTAFDAAVSYLGSRFRASLNVRNIVDKAYFAGGLNNNVVSLGGPRQVLLNVVFDL